MRGWLETAASVNSVLEVKLAKNCSQGPHPKVLGKVQDHKGSIQFKIGHDFSELQGSSGNLSKFKIIKCNDQCRITKGWWHQVQGQFWHQSHTEWVWIGVMPSGSIKTGLSSRSMMLFRGKRSIKTCIKFYDQWRLLLSSRWSKLVSSSRLPEYILNLCISELFYVSSNQSNSVTNLRITILKDLASSGSIGITLKVQDQTIIMVTFRINE